MNIHNSKIIQLPKITDERGSLTFLESQTHIPFMIKRIFYLYDVPEMKNRGAHAHKKCQQFLICLSGSLDVQIDDGKEQKIFTLDNKCSGIYIPPMVWATEFNFKFDAVCLVLASDHYDENDYIRDYQIFIDEIGKK